MQETILRRAGRAIHSLHHTGFLVPTVGLATIGVSAYAMAAIAHAFPETAMAPEGFAQCNPFGGDFGCGHGFGCACHLMPQPDPVP